MKNSADQEPITRSLHLTYKLYETTFARIFLFLETAGFLDSRTIYSIQSGARDTVQYNTIQHSKTQLYKTQHNTMHYRIRFLGNLS